ncbi:hypothetical protein CC80DRAFT_14598 [Byssothecium circinans]|uniref:Uncharacterized protein n=1 Tax=Byssothecium circinans TaxID=147558 RepID=A0A6A5U6G7_9PLEO|nr:hypothetical protein CC80DRAFT_14598 [Byssothecium circinans]
MYPASISVACTLSTSLLTETGKDQPGRTRRRGRAPSPSLNSFNMSDNILSWSKNLPLEKQGQVSEVRSCCAPQLRMLCSFIARRDQSLLVFATRFGICK